MANYGVTISLSQAYTSDGDSSDHSPRSASTLSASGGGDCSTNSKTTPCDKIITLDDRYYHQTPSSSDYTARKPRGRPPGSKNKPKPPFVIARDSNSTRKTVILEISAGSDVIDTIISFARTNNVGVRILSATGSVSRSAILFLTIQHSLFMDPFGLLSSRGSFIASSTLSSSNKTTQSSSSSATLPSPCSSSSSVSSSFGVTLAGARGQVSGGIVGGKVMAATLVIVVAKTFIIPEFHTLPCEGDDSKEHHQETKPLSS